MQSPQERDSQTMLIEMELSRATAAEYKADIIEHLISLDEATRPQANMIDMQPEIEWSMWPYLIDFMVDVHSKLRLEPQTLFLAVNIVNRYCTRRIVFRKHFQLVGCTALWVAAKYEEKKGRVPTLAILDLMCCNVYDPQLFVQLEGHILSTLDWVIGHSSVDAFLSVCLSHGASPLLVNLMRYLAELTLYHREFVGADPYVVARSIHRLALQILGFFPSLDSATTTPEEQTHIDILCTIIKNPSHTVSDKYASTSRFQVSRLVATFVLKQEQEKQRELQRRKEAACIAKKSMESPAFAPLTPPQSAFHSKFGNSYQHSNVSSTSFYGYTPPSLSSVGSSSSLPSRTDQSEDSPLTIRSVDTGFDLVDCHDRIGSSPPVTPLHPPKRPFANMPRLF